MVINFWIHTLTLLLTFGTYRDEYVQSELSHDKCIAIIQLILVNLFLSTIIVFIFYGLIVFFFQLLSFIYYFF